MRLARICSVVILGIAFNAYNQENTRLVHSKISECKQFCKLDAGIIKQERSNDTLFLEIGAYLYCGADYRGSYEWYGDTLNLILKIQPDEKGRISRATCTCYYAIEYQIEKTEKLPGALLINDDTFEKNSIKFGPEKIVYPEE